MTGMWFLSLTNSLRLLSYRKLDGYERRRSLRRPTFSLLATVALPAGGTCVDNNAQLLWLSNNKIMDALVAHIPYFPQSLQWHALAKSEVVWGMLILTLMTTLMLKLVQLLMRQLARKRSPTSAMPQNKPDHLQWVHTLIYNLPACQSRPGWYHQLKA